MPGNILNADTGFPRFQEGQSNSDKIDIIMNYLYMLLEQLRYSMGNLDEKNFSPEGLEQLQKVITEPVYIELQNEDGKIANIALTADGITARLNNMYVTPFSDQDTYDVGACVLYDGSVWRCIEAVTTAGAWDASKWEECEAGSVETQLTITNQNVNSKIDGPGAQSLINQTLGSVTIQVVDTEAGTVSQIGAYSGGNIIMTAENIRLAGLVTFSSLADAPGQGDTVIDGGWLKTSMLQGNLIQASEIQGTYIDGGYIYGAHGLFGPRVITRAYLSNQSSATNKRFKETKIDDGSITFSVIDRGTWSNAFKDGSGNISDGTNAKTGLPETNTIDHGTLTKYGEIYADYVNGQMYISTMGTYKKQLKLESGMNMSLTATLETSESGDTPTYYSKDTDTSVGLRGGTIYIGTEPDTRFPTNYGQKIMIGSAEGHVVIAAHDDTYGNTTRPYKDSEKGNVGYEFRTDGIYFHGRRIVDSSQTV